MFASTMFGVSSYCVMDRPLPEALDVLAGMTGLIEVMDEGPHFIADTGIFESYSQDFVIHAPFHGMNIASVFEPIRVASVGVMTDCFAVAAEIGAPVVVHPGYYAWAGEREAADRQFGTSLAELHRAADELAVTFWFENMGDMNFFNLRTPEELGLIGDTGFTLDVGHAHLNGRLPGFLGTGFSHMHLHDNNGKRDSHDAVGEGTIDFGPVVAALRRNRASSVVEVKTLDSVRSSLSVLGSL
ncbi:MAG TPA: sugar phosphate isomerase/epimerase family protein [Methanoregula sp.]|nr:sugar phosphate isomerase/epimerase family protein [Methanoregula sp.]